jgi:uncharacterized membrane protein YdjX (TVP38/TMEM64 family)
VSARVLLRGLLLILSLAVLGWLSQRLELTGMLSEHWVDDQVRGKGWSGELLFLGMGALTTALGFPRQVVAFLGGYALGFVEGATLALFATVCGSVLTFFFARWLGRGLVQDRFPGRIRTLDDFLHGHPFAMALTIRLLPVGSNVATNLVAGVSSVPGLPFFAGSALGYVPQTVVFALAGSGVHFDPALRLSLALALFVASSLLGVWLYRRHRRGAALEDEIDRALGESRTEEAANASARLDR